jgi:hypothetical protein
MRATAVSSRPEQMRDGTKAFASRMLRLAEVIASMGMIGEEADEAVPWLELLTASGIILQDKTGELRAFQLPIYRIAHLLNA